MEHSVGIRSDGSVQPGLLAVDPRRLPIGGNAIRPLAIGRPELGFSNPVVNGRSSPIWTDL